MNKTYKLATRASKLALYQANWVKSLLAEHHPQINIEIVPIKTSGDLIQDRPLREVGGKALFLKEIEEALIEDRADFAVHSMKDVPAQLPQGLKLGVILPREDVSDILISNANYQLSTLPTAAKVGTSSLRRKVQLKKARPDLEVLELRGNVDTRLRKLSEGVYDAIILAYAGLKRLNLLEGLYYHKLDFIPSSGQGAVGIEYAQSNSELEQVLMSLHDVTTAQEVNTERLFNLHFDASCNVPLGAHVKVKKSNFELRAFLSDETGEKWVEGKKVGDLTELNDSAEQMIKEFKKSGI